MTKASTDIGALANQIGVPSGARSDAEKAVRPPPFCGDFDIHIASNGTWSYRGSPIGRLALVKLFASVLRRDEAGDYWLVTPAERGRITVDDAPFTAVELSVEGAGREQQLIFRTNLDEVVSAGPDHPIRVSDDAATGQPRPYLLIHTGLEARILRPVYYQLVELGGEEQVGSRIRFGVWSRGTFFELGELEEGA